MAGIDGFGTQWLLGDSTDSTFDLVADVVSIDVLDISVNDIDVTAHDSTGGWMEFVGGLKDGGELTMDINFDPDVHDTLLDAVGDTRNQKIILPDDASGATVTFDGYINSFSLTAPSDDKLSAEVVLKVSGPVTLTIPA